MQLMSGWTLMGVDLQRDLCGLSQHQTISDTLLHRAALWECSRIMWYFIDPPLWSNRSVCPPPHPLHGEVRGHRGSWAAFRGSVSCSRTNVSASMRALQCADLLQLLQMKPCLVVTYEQMRDIYFFYISLFIWQEAITFKPNAPWHITHSIHSNLLDEQWVITHTTATNLSHEVLISPGWCLVDFLSSHLRRNINHGEPYGI